MFFGSVITVLVVWILMVACGGVEHDETPAPSMVTTTLSPA